MAETYFLGDCHFGHKNILQFRPRFKTIKEHDDFIINRINATVTKWDKLVLVGDICFNEAAVALLHRINCNNIHLLLGNHDDYTIDFKALCPKIKWVSGDYKYKEFWVSHIPLHPDCLRQKFNIHAHLHETKLKDRAFIGVSCEQVDYTPISVTQIRKINESTLKKKKGFTSWLKKKKI